MSQGKTNESSDSGDLQASELGTKDYWENAYEREIKNFKSHGDVGEVWFGEDSELRIIRWLKSSDRVKENDSIIDIGCGNGMLLIELAKEDFTDLSGVDYSETAIKLATSIAEAQDFSQIKFQVCDIVKGNDSLTNFSVALDKGTYDAISLDPEDSRTKRLQYKNNISKLLKDEGLFIITSCNWTEKELVEYFVSHFKVLNTIPAPSFHFGGKTGCLVSTVVFQKIA